MVVSAPGEGGVWRNEPLLHAFFLLHPPVLEPYLHLGFIELQGSGNLNSSGSGQVLVEMELFF